MSIKEKLLAYVAVIEAHERGEPIEYRPTQYDTNWRECPTPNWTFDMVEYRVKPNPEKARREAVELAFKQGKMIECRNIVWSYTPRPSWTWDEFDYRVKE